MKRVKRYEWEDALVDAQRDGHINNGALLLCLKLSKAITWEPKDKKPSGLYWKNEDALKDVGAGRATYFRYRESLIETGFLLEEGGNLIPVIPEQSHLETVLDKEESHLETNQSQVETNKSQSETQESLGDNPYSVDTYTVDEFTVDKSVETAPPAAGSSSETSVTYNEVSFSKIIGPDGPLASLYGYVVKSSEEVPQSLVETKDELDEKMDEYERDAKLFPDYDPATWVEYRAKARAAYESGAYVHKACGIAFGAVSA